MVFSILAEEWPQVRDRLDEIARIHIETQEAGLRIIAKSGPLRNPAGRDHCLQYMLAVALLHGTLTEDHYEAHTAADPRIDRLRELMDVVEQQKFSRDYLDPAKRSIANAVQVFFADGSASQRVEVEYPLGHRRRRDEARPELFRKFERNAGTRLPPSQVQSLLSLWLDVDRLNDMSVCEFVDATLSSNLEQ